MDPLHLGVSEIVVHWLDFGGSPLLSQLAVKPPAEHCLAPLALSESSVDPLHLGVSEIVVHRLDLGGSPLLSQLAVKPPAEH